MIHNNENEIETSIVHEFNVFRIDYTYIDLGCVRWRNGEWINCYWSCV